jgi:hypothetical protein
LQVAGPLIAATTGLIVGVHNTISLVHLTLLALLSGVVGLALAFPVTFLIGLLKAPKLVYMQQLSTISDRDRRIQELELAESRNATQLDNKIKFDFYLDVATKETTPMIMGTPYPGNSMSVDVPTIYLVVTNKGRQHIDFLSYKLPRGQAIQIGHTLSPHLPERLNITENFMESLIGTEYPQLPTARLLNTSLLVECLGDGEAAPVSVGPKQFVAEIERARRPTPSLTVKIRPVAGGG